MASEETDEKTGPVTFTFDGTTFTWDASLVTLEQAFVIKNFTTYGIVSWMRGVMDCDPGCIQSLWWVINAQNAKTMTIEEAGSVLPLQLLDAVLSGSIVDPTVTANIEAAAVVLAGEPTQEASHVAAEASSTSEPTPT